MTEGKIVWSDEHGDLRKKKNDGDAKTPVNEAELELKIRRLTSGKGRAVIEITGLPSNKKWCQKLAKDLKKSLGVGGAYKNDFIEVHGEKFAQVTEVLESKGLKYKKIGG
jgi:translation initiation factor 1